jgi:hypothetical protein
VRTYVPFWRVAAVLMVHALSAPSVRRSIDRPSSH